MRLVRFAEAGDIHIDSPISRRPASVSRATLQGGFQVKSTTAPEVRTQPDSELFHTISQGKRVMRSFAGELEDEEIQSLIMFIRTLRLVCQGYANERIVR